MPEHRLPDFACTANAIAWHARHAPDNVAVVEQGRRITYRQLATDLTSHVRFLRERDVRHDMLVGIEAAGAFYAQTLMFLAGEVIGVTATAFRRTDLVNDDPVLPDCDLLLVRAPPPSARQPLLVVPDDVAAGSKADTAATEPVDLEEQPGSGRIVRISRTSGSTGRAKAVPITYAVQQDIINNRIRQLPDAIAPAPRFLCIYGVNIRASYTRVYATLLTGGTVIFAHGQQVPYLLTSGTANWLALIAGSAELLVREVSAPPDGMPLLVELIGARSSPALRRLVRTRLNAIVRSNYSSNEVNTIATTDEDELAADILPDVSVRIVDEAGNDKALGETGLIRVRTSTMATGYWNEPALTAAAFIDGWYHTNDFGYMPEPGKLVVLGRADDMLNIGGIKLAPGPLEDEIKQLPGVRDAALLGITRELGLDSLLVAVEIDGTLPLDFRARIAPILNRYVGKFDILPLPSFPRTENGKIRRSEIAAAFRRSFG
ncbi:MAG: acyl--CoA ligase [Proteobacteria bacterium]|nr:acyl--CoA ligase [Pseudomonadota bacterium]